MGKVEVLYQWFLQKRAERCAQALEKNGFHTRVFPDLPTAIDHILETCEEVQSIGFGGSLTLAQLGIYRALEGSGKTLLNHGLPHLSPQERMEILRQQQTCQLFLTSTNAVTLDGKLVNMDGTGNRVSAMAFGPEKVVVVAGANKIVPDVSAAIQRIKEYAAPMNAKRLGFDTPCANTGFCADCSSPRRICNILTILEKCPPRTPIHVILIAQSLGL